MGSIKLIFDPKYGGEWRLALKLLALVSTILVAIAGSFPTLAWVASAQAAVVLVISGVTHLMSLGDVPPA
jgi:hypothetical protein